MQTLFMNSSFSLSKLAAAMALIVPATVMAQAIVAPDAGQVLRELPPLPSMQPAGTTTLQRIEEKPEDTAESQDKVFVKRIALQGNASISTEALQPFIAPLVGRECTLSQLNAAARVITAYYREQGYAVARAYLPTQDITDGTVVIAIMEGHIDRQRLDNRSLLSDEQVRNYLDQVKDGDTIKSSQIDRGLLLLQDTPGVGNSRATLQPGASVGTSELLVEVSPAARVSGSAGIDNYGSRYTGEYRASGNLNLASPLGIGDQLAFNVVSSGNQLNFGRLAYQLPIGSDGLRVGAAWFDMRYRLGKEFAQLDAHGSAASGSVFATYPLIRSQARNLYTTLSFENKKLDDRVDTTQTDTRKTVRIGSLGLAGNQQDMLGGGGGITSGELTLWMGRLNIDSPSTRAIDDASAKTAGNYQRLVYRLGRLQRLGDRAMLILSFEGQQASKNLDSSEKFNLGGPTGVRAYPSGEATGDEGYRGTLEWRYNVLPAVQGTLFYDFGEVTINKTPYGTQTNNQRRLSGSGFGVNANIANIQLRSGIAWRTGSERPNSIPSSAVRTPTIWVQALTTF